MTIILRFFNKGDGYMDKKAIIFTAITSALALGATTIAQAGHGEHEKCYGIVKAGMNDCGSDNHACAAQSKEDSNKGEWVYLPKGTCAKVVGGSITKGGDVDNDAS
jgi:uncharacterized membrane protein